MCHYWHLGATSYELNETYENKIFVIKLNIICMVLNLYLDSIPGTKMFVQYKYNEKQWALILGSSF